MTADLEARRLGARDEGPHRPGSHLSWNESRYVDLFDAEHGVGAWLRLGNRPNEGRAEMSVCVNLPDGTTAFMFERALIDDNGLVAGGQCWAIDEPYVRSRVTYDGDVLVLPDSWALGDPKRAFRESKRAPCAIDLVTVGSGLASVMGQDQSDIDRIFLPGQADWHYQHLVRTTGTVRVGAREWTVSGRGGRDHSWGPRNWLSKTYMRWLIAAVDDDLGFMLTRAVGPTKQTRGGFVWQDGVFHLVDDFEMRNRFAGEPHHELHAVDVAIRSGDQTWTARGEPRSWVPLRHVQAEPNGASTLLRIVKSPAQWIVDGREGVGMLEYHDQMDDGRPAGLRD